MGSDLEIVEVTDALSRAAFLDLPYDIYRADPAWRAPLRFERAEQLDPRRNPGLARIESAYFLARRGNRVVGRCAAFVNHDHLDRHCDATGHFGFLDTCQDDSEAIPALMREVGDWLRARGMLHIAGPYNFSVNEECGLLVDGFEQPPVVMMPHGRPDYPGALEALGFEKAMDLYAYRIDVRKDLQKKPIARSMMTEFAQDKSLSVRPMRTSAYSDEIKLAMDIFNDAWSNNWGFIPFGQEQISHIAKSIKPLMDRNGFWVGSINGEPASIAVMIPNLNEAIEGLNGKLLPFGWLKLLYRLKVKGVKSGRIPLMGTRRRYHKTRKGLALTLATFEACVTSQKKRGMEWAELSWVLETNKDVQRLIHIAEVEHYKTYRIYTKPL
jgi:hypothetical protein